MSTPCSLLARAATLAGSCFLVMAACWGQTQTAPAPPRSGAHSKKVDPQINAQFQKADVKAFIKRFESNDREVYVKRREIVRALGLKPGMAVADVGAGTGLFTRLMADVVGPRGKVYAVDVSKGFLDYIASQAKSRGQQQIVTIQGTQDSTNLPPGSVDLVFLCDVYHHLEQHEKILASIHRALRVHGVLVLVEFDRVEGSSSEFVLKHIRAGQAVFRREIEAAGFEPVPSSRGTQAQGELRCEIPEEGRRCEKEARADSGGDARRHACRTHNPEPPESPSTSGGRSGDLGAGLLDGYWSRVDRGWSRVNGGRRVCWARVLQLVPELDEGLRFRVTPGQPGLFQVVGASPPLFAPFDGPVRHHAAIGQGVENRSRRPCAGGRPVRACARRLGRTAKTGTPG